MLLEFWPGSGGSRDSERGRYSRQGRGEFVERGLTWKPQLRSLGLEGELSERTGVAEVLEAGRDRGCWKLVERRGQGGQEKNL